MQRTRIVTYTRAAFLPHITPSLSAHITTASSPQPSPQNVLITLEHMLSITTPSSHPSPLRQTHAHLAETKIFMCAADVCAGGDNTVTVEETRLTLNKAVVLLLPNRQQYRISVEAYIDAYMNAGADVCIALNDYQTYQETLEREDVESSAKRVKVDTEVVTEADLKRNVRFLSAQLAKLKTLATSDEARIMQLYARVHGGEDLIPKLNAALILEECDGYVIRVPVHTTLTDYLSTLPSCVQSALKDQSDTRKPVWVYGIRSASILYEAVALGAALIDDSWAYTATRCNTSIDLHPYLTSILAGMKADKEIESEVEVSGGAWRGKMEKLSAGCGCVTCERHTKAYVYHLVERGEISAKTLLQVHNMYQIRWFVEESEKFLKR